MSTERLTTSAAPRHALRYPDYSAEYEVTGRQATLSISDGMATGPSARLHLNLDRVEGLAELLWMLALDLRRNGATSAMERAEIDAPWKEEGEKRGRPYRASP